MTIEPAFELGEQWYRLALPEQEFLVGRLVLGARLDLIELGDECERRMREPGNPLGLGNFEVFSPSVREASDFDDSPRSLERLKTGIGIGLQIAAIVLEKACRMHRFS